MPTSRGPARRSTPSGPRPSARRRGRAAAPPSSAATPSSTPNARRRWRRATSDAASTRPLDADQPPPSRSSLTTRAAVLLGVLAILAASYALPVRAWLDQRTQLEQARTDRDALAAEVDALTDARDLWEDPAYVRAQARERLNYVLPGEVGLVVLGTEATPEEEPMTGAVVPAVDDDQPWWSSLVAAFTEAGTGVPSDAATDQAAPAEAPPADAPASDAP